MSLNLAFFDISYTPNLDDDCETGLTGRANIENAE